MSLQYRQVIARLRAKGTFGEIKKDQKGNPITQPVDPITLDYRQYKAWLAQREGSIKWPQR